MTIYTHTFDLNVQGKVESSSQGTLVGAVETMPPAGGCSGIIVLYNGSEQGYEKGKYYYSNGSTWTLAANNVTVDGTIDKGSSNPVSNTTVATALEGKQNRLSAGTGITISDDTVSLANSGVVAGTKGTTTAIPQITVDATGRVTSLSDVKVYPPTTTGIINQYWRSNGTGVGEWTTPENAATQDSDTLITAGAVYTELDKKVTKVTGKGLSTNDYTTEEKDKLKGITAGAQVNKIETVKVNGTALAVTSKAVNIDLSKYATHDDLAAIGSGEIKIEVVDQLPTENISTGTIYMVPNTSGSYDKYVYSNSEWVNLGSSEVDMSDYVKKADAITGLSVSGTTVTFTKGDGKTGTITTQDTNTDTMVTQSNTTGASVYPILLKNGTGSGTVTKEALFNSDVTVTPSTGTITATTFIGNLVGNADTATSATKATQDGEGRVISDKYATKEELKDIIAGQLDITGAASTIVSENLAVSKALISDSSGKVAVSAVTSTELGYLDGVTSNIQTQFSGKQDRLTSTGATNQPIYIDSTGKPTVCSYTLGAAASKSVVQEVVQDSTALVTSGAVYRALQTATGSFEVDDTPTYGSSNPVSSGGVYAELALKESKLTFDDVPTSGSTNPVKSGGIYDAIDAKENKLTFDDVPKENSQNPVRSSGIFSELAGKQPTLQFDSIPTEGSSKSLTSGTIYTALKAKQNNLIFDSEPKSGSSNPVASGGVFSALQAKQNNLTFDEAPSATSENPVKSKGIYSAIAKKQDAITVSSAEPDSATGSDGDLWAVYE